MPIVPLRSLDHVEPAMPQGRENGAKAPDEGLRRNPVDAGTAQSRGTRIQTCLFAATMLAPIGCGQVEFAKRYER